MHHSVFVRDRRVFVRDEDAVFVVSACNSEDVGNNSICDSVSCTIDTLAWALDSCLTVLSRRDCCFDSELANTSEAINHNSVNSVFGISQNSTEFKVVISLEAINNPARFSREIQRENILLS